MHVPILLKIRAALIMALGVFLFYFIGWSIVQPWDPRGTFSLTTIAQPHRVILVMFGLALLASLGGTLISGRYMTALAPLAVIVGLSCWSFKAGNVRDLLLKYPDVPQRISLFRSLAAETILWFFMVALAFIVAIILTLALRINGKFETDDFSSGPGGKKSWARLSDFDIINSIIRSLQESREEANPPEKPGALNNFTLRLVLALGACVIIGMFLMKLFLQAGTTQVMAGDGRIYELTTSPALGQVIFAVIVSFFFAALAADQFFDISLWVLLPAPAIVAIMAYLGASREATLAPLAGMAPTFFMSSTRTALVLPVQYIGLGTFGLIWGYWVSTKMRLTRMQNKLEKDSDES